MTRVTLIFIADPEHIVNDVRNQEGPFTAVWEMFKQGESCE